MNIMKASCSPSQFRPTAFRRSSITNPFFYRTSRISHERQWRFFHTTRVVLKTPWEVLGIDEGASEEEIKKAYIKMSRKYHPDVSKEKDATDKFTEVVKAYNILKDPEKRKRAETSDFDDFDYRGNYEDQEVPTNINLYKMLFEQRDEMGVNHLQVLLEARKEMKKHKKEKKKQKVDLQKVFQEKLSKFLLKPVHTAFNIKREFPQECYIKETPKSALLSEYPEMLLLTPDKLFIMGYITSTSHQIKHLSIYRWENKDSNVISDGFVEFPPESSSSSITPKTFTLTINAGSNYVGMMKTSFFPLFPFISITKCYNEWDHEIAKISRLHFFGTRFSITNSTNPSLHINPSSQTSKPSTSSSSSSKSSNSITASRGVFSLFREYKLNYRCEDQSIHPSFLVFSALISHQLDISTFSLVNYLKKALYKLSKKFLRIDRR